MNYSIRGNYPRVPIHYTIYHIMGATCIHTRLLIGSVKLVILIFIGRANRQSA